jgi:hypothetical protein
LTCVATARFATFECKDFAEEVIYVAAVALLDVRQGYALPFTFADLILKNLFLPNYCNSSAISGRIPPLKLVCFFHRSLKRHTKLEGDTQCPLK